MFKALLFNPNMFGALHFGAGGTGLADDAQTMCIEASHALAPGSQAQHGLAPGSVKQHALTPGSVAQHAWCAT